MENHDEIASDHGRSQRCVVGRQVFADHPRRLIHNGGVVLEYRRGGRLRDLTPSEWRAIMTSRWRNPARLLIGLIALWLVAAPARAFEDARAYLVATATPGFTMLLQGPTVAIERLHPDF